MLNMQAARLRHRVLIQKYEERAGSLGHVTKAWVDWAHVWAAVEPLRGQEFIAAQAMQATTTVRVRMRYRPGIDSQMRLVFEGRLYNIKAVIETETRRREIQLMCEVGASAG